MRTRAIIGGILMSEMVVLAAYFIGAILMTYFGSEIVDLYLPLGKEMLP